MWLFTRYGFYSVACAANTDGAPDADMLMIRARSKGHLQKLQQRFAAIADAGIATTPDRDYRYRIVVPKTAWVSIAADLAEEQTWSNFKNEAARFQGKGGGGYVHALHDVWDVMHRMQRAE